MLAPLVTCSSANPCQTFTNTASGGGVKGVDFTGIGVQGSSHSSTGVVGNSSSGTGVAAVSGSGTGLIASSATGPGIVSTASSDAVAAGTTNPSKTNGYGRSGVYGHDDSTDGGTLDNGVAGFSTSGTGVQGGSRNGNGVDGHTSNTTTTSNPYNFAGVYGHDDTACTFCNDGVRGISDYGTGVEGDSAFGVAMFARSSGGTAFVAFGPAAASSDFNYVNLGDGNFDPIDVHVCCSTGNRPLLTLDPSGNLSILGTLTTSGPCSSGCAVRKRVVSYAPRESVPSIEDFGEATLQGGQAQVALDPAFANVIDRRAKYLVFITPEGDCNGLYVSQRTPDGFVVRELRRGHSTLAFNYRIVAKPFGVTAARLPFVDAVEKTNRHALRSPRGNGALIRGL